jgi:hypothetical protein
MNARAICKSHFSLPIPVEEATPLRAYLDYATWGSEFARCPG